MCLEGSHLENCPTAAQIEIGVITFNVERSWSLNCNVDKRKVRTKSHHSYCVLEDFNLKMQQLNIEVLSFPIEIVTVMSYLGWRKIELLLEVLLMVL